VSLRRSDLYRVLHAEALRRGIDVRYGWRLAAARTTPDGVTATSAHGTTESADPLVGADGVRSTVRTLLDPGPRHPASCRCSTPPATPSTRPPTRRWAG
jgi:2-polyprenyl-6-methoxyphenol hydroxylase-like FAD-dependent oxidoreductase